MVSEPSIPDLQGLWQQVIATSDIQNRAWLRRTRPVDMHGSTLMLGVIDETMCERIETRLRQGLETQLSDICGQPTHLAVMIMPDLVVEDIVAPTPPEDLPPQPMLPRSKPQELRLNPRYTFESFVAGSSNRFAHAAAAAVAETPGKSYNPLMIYGPSGLGKTHLLHAIGHYVSSYYEQLRVKYVSTEELTNDFINAISSNRTAEFRSSYRDVDVLLVDDILFLESKSQTQ